MRSGGGLLCILMIAALIAIGSVTSSSAWAEGAYWLNEDSGILRVTGVGWPPAAMSHPGQARLMAERAAIVDAYATAARLLSVAIPQITSGREGYSVFLRGSKVRRTDVAPDGSVEVELEIPVSLDLGRRLGEVIR